MPVQPRQCKQCGVTFTPKTRHLNRASAFCSKSCSSKYHFGDGITHKINSKSKYRWLLHRVSSNVRHKKRDLEFDLSVEDLQDIDKKQNGKCALSGITLEFRNQYGPSQPYQASVDRIDHNKGYTKDNVRLICIMANYCRNGYTDKDVIEFCRAVALYHSAEN